MAVFLFAGRQVEAVKAKACPEVMLALPCRRYIAISAENRLQSATVCVGWQMGDLAADRFQRKMAGLGETRCLVGAADDHRAAGSEAIALFVQ